MKSFADIYKFPLSIDELGWVYDQAGNFVFQFTIDDTEKQELLLSVINGKSELTNPELVFIHQYGKIIDNNNKPVILIRGWGNLTGVGSLNLPIEEANNIQDTFAEYIIGKLNTRTHKNYYH